MLEKYFQRFELRDGDCFGDETWTDCDTDRERVEFSTRPRQAPKGKQCYGYSLMLSKDFIDIHPTSTTLGQVHQHGGPTGKAEGLASFPPLIQIDARYGHLFFNWHELRFSTRPRQAPKGKQCYGYSLMLSKDFIDTHPTSTTLGQVHQHGGPTGTAEGLASFPPLIQIDARSGSFVF